MLIAQTWGTVPRFLFTLPIALFTTLCLLFFMAHLIHSDMPPLVDEPYPVIPPIVMEPVDPEPINTPKPTRAEQPEPEPARPEQKWEPPVNTGGGISREPYKLPKQKMIASTDSLPFARVMAPPVYPHHAASRGIEGFVDLRFDVTAAGATRNIQVVYAEPEGVFEQSAMSAVARWRFQPKMVDGKPEPFIGLSKRVRFALE